MPVYFSTLLGQSVLITYKSLLQNAMSNQTMKLIPVLDRSNYNAWYKAMKAYLMAYSLWGYANGNITHSADNNEEWDKENSVAIGNIVL